MSAVEVGQSLRRVEIGRERRVRGALRAWGLMVFASVFLPTMCIAALGLDRIALPVGIALSVLGAALTLLAIPILLWLGRTNLRAPVTLAASRDALELVDADDRAQWRTPWTDVGLAWTRAPRVLELATASGDEALLFFSSPEERAAALRTIRRRAHDRRAYPLALASGPARVARGALSWLLPVLAMPAPLVLGPLGWALLLGALALAWRQTEAAPRMVLGADGVMVRDRYVPYREIEAIERRSYLPGLSSLTLRLSRDRVRLGYALERRRASLVHALLSEGLEMVERGEAAGAGAAALTPDGDGDAWMRALDSASARRGYRTAALDADRLSSIVRNPAAEPAQRIAAALALRGEPGGPARIRVAADVTAEPEVRDALDALASDEDDRQSAEQILRRVSAYRR